MRTTFPAVRMMAVLVLTFIVIAGAGLPGLLWSTVLFAFPSTSNPSLTTHDGRVAGARIIGRILSGAGYFQLVPSAGATALDLSASGGNHLDTDNEKLLNEIRELLEAYLAETGPTGGKQLPSSHGRSDRNVDPLIRLDQAFQQAQRIAQSRGLSVDVVRGLIEANTESRNLSAFGGAAVNVLMLNLALDSLTASRLR